MEKSSEISHNRNYQHNLACRAQVQSYCYWCQEESSSLFHLAARVSHEKSEKDINTVISPLPRVYVGAHTSVCPCGSHGFILRCLLVCSTIVFETGTFLLYLTVWPASPYYPPVSFLKLWDYMPKALPGSLTVAGDLKSSCLPSKYFIHTAISQFSYVLLRHSFSTFIIQNK